MRNALLDVDNERWITTILPNGIDRLRLEHEQSLLFLAITSGDPASPLLQRSRFIHPISLFQAFKVSAIEIHT
jgi:hypothetical protein